MARYLDHLIPIVMSSVVPRDRMVVLELWDDVSRDDPAFVNTYGAIPVLAIVTSQSHHYGRERIGEGPGYDPGERTHKEMLDAGWRYDGITPIQVELIVDDCEVGPSALSQVKDEKWCYKVVTCTWPPEQDDEQFAPYVEQLQKEFRTKKARAEARTTVQG